MKRKSILMILAVCLLVFGLASCKKDKKRTYVCDGNFTAYLYDAYNGGAQVHSVTVTIKDDKIEKFFIDARQSNVTKDADTGAVTASVWKEKTKRELGYEYFMFAYSGAASCKVNGVLDVEAYKTWLATNGKKEWFEQADLIEAALLANLEGITLKDGKYENVSNVSINDAGVLALAKKAVQNAKDGKLEAFACYQDDIIMGTAKVDKDGKVTEYKLDTCQGAITEGVWNFKAQTKQELGYNYFMHSGAAKATCVVNGTLDVEKYKTWLADNNKKEWFEQAALICEAFASTGSVTVADGKFANIAGVSISNNNYDTVLNALKNFNK